MARLKCAPPLVRPSCLAVAKVPPKTADAIYGTPEHRAWSAGVIARARGVCQMCGRSNGRMFADHIREVKDGGALLDPANGQCLCGSCHSRKTAAERARRFRRPEGEGV
ncbi:MAG TPA: HNH endonuclease signature motif containing protein [Rhodoblastus sp.]|nr:HNH endonuclease signature motif containing protein [Rhodoblastus sp.]